MKALVYFICHYFYNNIATHFPSNRLRILILKLLRGHVGQGSFIGRGCFFDGITRIYIADKVYISGNCHIQACAVVHIGENTYIEPNVSLITGSHDLNSNHFSDVIQPISIEDNVFVGVGSIILKGVKICRNSIITAGSIVISGVDESTCVKGIPAKKTS